ncbi:unnamed protein product [Ectocarpus sp. 12 AP-2014]
MDCSDGDSFFIDSNVTYESSQSFNGCYDASADTFNSETQYFLDGDEVGGTPGVYSSAELHDDHGVWALAYYTTDGEFSRRCKDAAEEDSSTLHPADVLQWDCKDADEPDSVLYSDIDAAVTITCGCDSPTPAPTTSETPAPAPSPAPSPTPSPTSPSRATPSTPSPAALSPTTPSPTTPSTALPASVSPELMAETSSAEATPVGAIAGGGVAGVLAVGAIILAVLFKSGRLKTCRGGSRETPADDVVAPASASGSVPTQGTRVETTAAHTARHYPVAHQYPAAI